MSFSQEALTRSNNHCMASNYYKTKFIIKSFYETNRSTVPLAEPLQSFSGILLPFVRITNIKVKSVKNIMKLVDPPFLEGGVNMSVGTSQ